MRDLNAVRASAPESAALMKATLRKAFPAVKFTVRLARGTAYGYCSVRWTDGPTTKRVDAIVGQFEGSSFDGMTDMESYHQSTMPDGRLTGLRSVNTERTISARFAQRIAAAVSAYWGGLEIPIITEKAGYWQIAPGMNSFARDRTGRDWSELIYRASSDRSSIARER